MEFLEDFVELLARPHTLPSVGPPAVLAYRPEALRGRLRAEVEQDCAPRCEYCGSPLRPFPSFEDVCPPPQVAKNELVEKYYKHGGKFLTMLPDGTAQLLYPLWGLFAHSSPGMVTMNIAGGQCLDRTGSRVRRWTWPSSTASSEPCTPLSPIFLSLNLHVGVRIVSQDKITVSFLAMGQQAKFNVGTKVQGSQAGQLRAPLQLNEDELLLLALQVRILRLIDKMRGCLNFPSNEHWDRMKPPAYLVTQTLKLLHLCTTSDISEELCSSIRAIVNAPV
ncbi:UNVERIFIED_CONTAM: hypothetical protein H355_015176 [Colinus virginianus]|nr:hypothetical protein H355_015176 [Colinus virginianus]